MKKLQYAYLLTVIIALPFMSTCTTIQNQAYVKDGKEYGITKGLFKGRWWNYYERGVSFGEGGFLKEAEIDFKAALEQRNVDQRVARTYGMHFVDYFPHRELGIILYRLGRHEESVYELEISISNQESAKAKFYLNKARKSLIKSQNGDSSPPRITISTPEKNRTTNKFFATVSGEVTDENYVSAITINNISEFIELSGKNVKFTKKISLLPGPNEITITAKDLLGNTSKTSFNIVTDHQGPNLSILNLANNEQVNKPEIIVNMSYSDESGIKYVRLQDKKNYPENCNSGVVSTKIKLENGKNSIQMEAMDNAGNKTMGEVSIIYYPGKLVASNPVATDIAYQAKKTNGEDKNPPEINFTGLAKILADNEPFTITGRKNNNRIFVEGMASDNSGIKELLINDIPTSFTMGKMIVFNKLIEFHEGENQFKIFAKDSKGNVGLKSVKVNRRIQQIDLEESKMTISILPFKNNSLSKGLADSIYNMFIQEIVNSERFNLIERGPEFETILKELNLSQTELIDKEKALQAGKLLASEAILIGNIMENKNELDVCAKLLNIETSEYITIHDVYSQNKSRAQIEYLMAGLASEIVYSVPLIEGRVLAVKGKEFFIDIGKKNHFNIKSGVKCLVYRSTPFIVDGVVLGDDTSILGTLLINRVKPKFSSAVLYGSGQKNVKEIKKSDSVLTK